MRKIKIIVSLILGLIFQSTCYFSRGLHDSCGHGLRICKEKRRKIRRVVGDELIPKIIVCILRYGLKFKTNVRVTRTRMDFIFWKRRTEIFLQLSFKENLYENKYKAFVIYRETEILSRRRFFKSFSSSISFSNLLFIF